MQIVSVLKGTLDAPALNYVTSLGILLLAEVGRRSRRRQVGTEYTLRTRLVVWSANFNILYLSVLPLHIIIY